MYKVGEEVSVLDTEECRKYNGHYAGRKGEVFYVGKDYCDVRMYDGKICMFPNCHIEPVKFRVNVPRKCTCGSHATSFPKHHYDWCDLNMKIVTEIVPEADYRQYSLPFTD